MIACIPTKNRPDSKTHLMFEKAGIPCFHFLEPSEINESPLPNKISIEKNDMGISYVRNYILQWAKTNKHEWIIMCDDDVRAFGVVKNNRNVPVKSADIWHEILAKAKTTNISVFGINYGQYSWSQTKDYSLNTSFFEVCLLLRVEKIHWRYRQAFNMKEDRDFILQSIKNSPGVIKFNMYFYQCPMVGTNKGGLQTAYRQKKDEQSAKLMFYEYQPFAKMVSKNGRVDVKIHLKSYAQSLKRSIA